MFSSLGFSHSGRGTRGFFGALFLAFLACLTAAGGEPAASFSERYREVAANAQTRLREALLKKAPAQEIRGLLQEESQGYREIVNAFQSRRPREPLADDELLAVALCYEKLFRFPQTEELARRVFEKEAAHPGARRILFRSLLNQDKLREAEELVPNANSESRNNVEFLRSAYSLLAARYEVRRDWPNVLRHIESSIAFALGRFLEDPTVARGIISDAQLLRRASVTLRKEEERRRFLREVFERTEALMDLTAEAPAARRTRQLEGALFHVRAELLLAAEDQAGAIDAVRTWLESLQQSFGESEVERDVHRVLTPIREFAALRKEWIVDNRAAFEMTADGLARRLEESPHAAPELRASILQALAVFRSPETSPR